MKPFRDEIEALQQNGITKVAFKRMNDPEVIPLWFGEGDVPTPEFIREAAKRALDEGQTFYSHTRGRPELRDALKSYLEELYGIELDERRITVPGSAMLGVTIAAQAALSTGDEGLIVGPVWPNIDSVFRVTGAGVSYVRQRLTDNGWQLTAAEIIEQVTARTKAIFVNPPCNPTGWVMSREEQIKLLEFARSEQVLIIADEVYQDNLYGGEFISFAKEIGEREIALFSLHSTSKGFCGECGHRGGYLEVRNVPKVLGTDSDMGDILLKQASVSLCSNTAAIRSACRMVSALEPTEVPMALATSLAPIFHAM